MSNEESYVVHLNDHGIEYFFAKKGDGMSITDLHDMYAKSLKAEEEFETEDTLDVDATDNTKTKKEPHKKFSEIFVKSSVDVLTNEDEFLEAPIMAIFFENASPKFTMIEDEGNKVTKLNFHSPPETEHVDILREFGQAAQTLNMSGMKIITDRSTKSTKALENTGVFVRMRAPNEPHSLFCLMGKHSGMSYNN